MRRLLVFSAIAVLSASSAFSATPLSGIWQLPDDNIRIRIAQCGGGTVCGHLVSADKLKGNPRLKDKMNEDPALRGRPVRGLLILSGFKFDSDNTWKDGEIYNPDDGKTYKSEMTLADANTLEVKGCVVKPLCKSKTLTRVR